MADYPPPPPGGGWSPPPGAPDPYATERALAEWAASRGVTLVPQGDVRWYQAWYPFAFLFPTSQVGREARVVIGDANVVVCETFEGDPAKQIIHEDRHVVAFVTTPRLAYRAAVRSKQGAAGLLDDMNKGLNDLFSAKKPQQGLLGDPTFEHQYEVAGPNREEANAALPLPLRQLLLQGHFKGILEVRGQGLVVTFWDRSGFDAPSLEGTLGWVAQIVQAATQYGHVVTAPPA